MSTGKGKEVPVVYLLVERKWSVWGYVGEWKRSTGGGGGEEEAVVMVMEVHADWGEDVVVKVKVV